MEIITNTTEFYLETETAAALGKFDGVHIGHRRLLDEIILRKGRGLAACVFTFDPTPAVFFGSSDGRELTTKEEKRLLFERLGIDILIEYPLDAGTAAMPPEDFAVQVLARQMNVRYIAAGPLGRGEPGTQRFLRGWDRSLALRFPPLTRCAWMAWRSAPPMCEARWRAGICRLWNGCWGCPI